MSLSPPTPQLPMHTTQPTEFRKYRQVEYYDGKDRYVAESRRRPHVSQHMSSPTPGFQYRQSTSKDPSSNYIETAMSECHVGDSRPSLPERNPRVTNHVTPPSRAPKNRSKPVIIQTVTPSGVKEDNTKLLFETSDLPTPPQTPRISRLPTPDVPDLVDAPFCDCCIKAHTIKYCASCKVELCRN